MFCLKVPSDPHWAKEAARRFDAMLVDHAHCEMKAASNALSLAARHHSDLSLVRALTELAKEELDHFQQVLGFLERRNLPLSPPEVDEYAARLRRAAAAHKTDLSKLVDRLLVGALIEARSCERFKLLLAELDEAADPELHAFYTELFAAEARHYRFFCDMAVTASGDQRDAVLDRLETLSVLEGEIVRSLAANASRGTIHG
jgi:tRNA-(ms[2]io[6]A)-hydroxylase